MAASPAGIGEVGRAGAELPAGASHAQPVVIDWDRVRRHAAADVPERGVNVKRHADTLLRHPAPAIEAPLPAEPDPAGTPH